MRDDGDGQPWIAERGSLCLAERLERGRADSHGGMTAFRYLYVVVDTPRRAGPSITRSGDHEVALLRELVDYLLWGRHRSATLGALDDSANAELRGQYRF